MTCTRPIAGYRGPGGKLVPTRGRHLGADSELTVSCGQCAGCRTKRAMDWAIRCVHESQHHVATCRCGCHDQEPKPPRNCFLTLTYNDEHLPDDYSVDVETWKKFAKRLRKRIGPVRYFHVGEYGERTQRPHYHALLFGFDFSADRQVLKSYPDYDIWRSDLLDSIWSHGHCSIGNLTFETAAYCTAYVLKKIGGAKAPDHYSRTHPDGHRVQVRPEYATMSLKPAIGTGWFEKYKDETYRDDFIVSHNGQKYPVPRAYDAQLEKLDPVFLEAVKKAREERAPDLSPEQLRAREAITEAKSALYSNKQDPEDK